MIPGSPAWRLPSCLYREWNTHQHPYGMPMRGHVCCRIPAVCCWRWEWWSAWLLQRVLLWRGGELSMILWGRERGKCSSTAYSAAAFLWNWGAVSSCVSRTSSFRWYRRWTCALSTQSRGIIGEWPTLQLSACSSRQWPSHEPCWSILHQTPSFPTKMSHRIFPGSWDLV